MAANAVAMRNALVRLGCTAAAAAAIVDVQGIDDLDEFRVLKDEEIGNLCKVVRRPGGTMTDPATGDQVPATGTPVGFRAENNIKLAACWLRHRVGASRATVLADITLQNVRSTRHLRDLEAQRDEEPEAPTIETKDWPKTMEAIEECLRSSHGITNIPLAHVVRQRQGPPEGADPATNHTTMDEEMIARAPHRVNPDDDNSACTAAFAADDVTVFDELAAITRTTECWTHVKPHQRSRNGQEAFLALWNHHLGPNNVDDMAAKSERKLTSVSHFGEKKRWNFEKHVSVHKDQHSDLDGLRQHGRSGIDERSKVRCLMDGIKTDAMDTVKAQIVASATLRQDFDACVALFKDFPSQKSAAAPTVQISQVGTKKTRFANDQKGETGVELRHHKKHEHDKSSKAQKRELGEWREKTGHKRPKTDKQSGRQTDQTAANVAALAQTVASLASTAASVASNQKQQENDGSDDSNLNDTGGSGAEDGNSDRNHPALTRQGGRQGTGRRG